MEIKHRIVHTKQVINALNSICWNNEYYSSMIMPERISKLGHHWRGRGEVFLGTLGQRSNVQAAIRA